MTVQELEQAMLIADAAHANVIRPNIEGKALDWEFVIWVDPVPAS